MPRSACVCGAYAVIGIYLPRNSPIHRLRPGIKVVSLAVLGTVLFATSNVYAICAALVFVVALYAVARITFKEALAQIRPLLYILVIIFVVQVIFDSLETAFVVVARLIALVMLASLVSLTTKVSAMVDAIETALLPLERLGINASKCSLALSMAIRFVPAIAEKFQEVREAQKARGLDRSIKALAVPLIIRTIRIATEVAEALDARSYDGTKKPRDPRSSNVKTPEKGRAT